MARWVSSLRCLVVAAGLSATALALLLLCLGPLREASAALRAPSAAPLQFVDLLTWACAVLGGVATCWWWTTSMLAVSEARAAVADRAPALLRTRGDAAPPSRWRTLVLLACGAALATAAPASARGAGHGGADQAAPMASRLGAAARPQRAAGLLEGLPLPDRARGAVPAASSGPTHGPAVVVVVTGDCLWDLAAHHLGHDASVAAIAAYTSTLYADNALEIGPDPDSLRPGQVLRFPAPAPAADPADRS